MRTVGGSKVQAWPWCAGMNMKTTGTFTDVIGAWCHEAGDVDITAGFPKESALAYNDGDIFFFDEKATITINSGVWSFTL